MRNLLVIGLVLGLAMFASAKAQQRTLSAGGINVEVWNATDTNSPGYHADQGAVPTGYNSYDIVVDSDPDVDWTQSLMLSVLTGGGSFYQYGAPFGGDLHPMAALYSAYPGLGFDTYVVGTAYNIDLHNQDASLSGGALKLGGGAAVTMDTGTLDVTWFDTISPFSDGQIARITISTDANGSLDLGMYNVNSDKGVFFSSPENAPDLGDYDVLADNYLYIVGGEVVPEPATMTVLGVGLLGVLIRRRRRR